MTGRKVKITWRSIIFYGIALGVMVGLIELAIGYKYYSASSHGLGFRYGSLHLLPLLVPLFVIIFILKFDMSFWRERIGKALLLFSLILVGAALAQIYFPF